MPTKLGAHVLVATPDLSDYIQVHPAVIKLVGNWGMAQSIPKEILVIGREYQGKYDAQKQRSSGQTPLEAAQQFFNDQLSTYRANPDIGYWEGHNEPVWSAGQEMAWYAQFEIERMRLMAGEGLKCVIGNFSTGTPELALWSDFLPALEAAKDFEAILGLHEYSCPWMWWMTGKHQIDPTADEGDEGWTTLRYRKVYRHHLKEKGLGDVPLVITECGIDPGVGPKPPEVGAGGTWKELGDFWKQHNNKPDKADFYFQQLVWYDKELQKDDFVIGATIFTWGSFPGTWQNFDVAETPVAKKLIEYTRSNPAIPFVYPEKGKVEVRRARVTAKRIHCGINTDPANPQGNPSAQEIEELGATWVRFTFKDDSEGPQPSAFGAYDDVVQELADANIDILMILSYETCPGKPAHDADMAAWSNYIKRFATRCRQIAERYGPRVKAYQIWNEPDFLDPSERYDPCARAEVFGPLLKSAFRAIKEVSSATVVTGGLVSGRPSYLQQVRASTAGVLHADGVGVHPYGRRPTADWPRPDWGFGTIGDLIQQYHAVADKPIWITELGTKDIDVQGEFPRQAFEVLDRDLAGVASHAFWFCWSDGMVSPFGLVDADNRKKGSYASFRGFARQPMETPVRLPPAEPYRSHYVLFPQNAPWAWFKACRRYLRKFHVTFGENVDDAAKVHGTLGHTITCINPTDETLEKLQRLHPEARLDIIRIDSAAKLEAKMNERVGSNQRFP